MKFSSLIALFAISTLEENQAIKVKENAAYNQYATVYLVDALNKTN